MQDHYIYPRPSSHSRKRDRDDALWVRLAHVNMAGCPIGSLTQDEPLPGGYLGTSLTASLCPNAHLRWTKEKLKRIGKGLARAPLPPHIKQRLLLYGAHSKRSHTHYLMALSPRAVKAVDSHLDKLSRNVMSLPTSFPRAELHAPLEKIDLNIPSIWEDLCGTALRSRTQNLKDEGVLGITTRASLHGAASKFHHWPLELVSHSRKSGSPVCPSIVARNMAPLITGDLHPTGAQKSDQGTKL
jgi:hypothetical protein